MSDSAARFVPDNWISALLGRPVEPRPRRSADEIPAARDFWDLSHLNTNLPEVARFEERVLLRERDGVALTAEIYVPKGDGPFPALLYLHGGSWCLWSPAHVRRLAMRFAAQGYLTVNLDYGLAPEHPFPWAVQDAIFACRWLAEHAAQYGGDGARLVVVGDSAGANIGAAAVAAHLAAPGLGWTEPGAAHGLGPSAPGFSGCVFLYGVFDFPLLFQAPGKLGDSGLIETTWNLAYLGPNFVSVHRHPFVSPILAPTLDQFPPCYLACGDRDALLPQSLAMTGRLVEVGVPTRLSVVPGCDHEFLLLEETWPEASTELGAILLWLRGLRVRRDKL
jgi:acetyl esterase